METEVNDIIGTALFHEINNCMLDDYFYPLSEIFLPQISQK